MAVLLVGYYYGVTKKGNKPKITKTLKNNLSEVGKE